MVYANYKISVFKSFRYRIFVSDIIIIEIKQFSMDNYVLCMIDYKASFKFIYSFDQKDGQFYRIST